MEPFLALGITLVAERLDYDDLENFKTIAALIRNNGYVCDFINASDRSGYSSGETHYGPALYVTCNSGLKYALIKRPDESILVVVNGQRF
jgi:hypothetical protein